jgi:riboflavin kinase/FMN adenylyltransferase
VLGKVSKNKTVISSSLIRKCISKGELKEASRLLGRNFSLSGKIVKGRGQGIKLGFPTANVRIFNHVMPPGGVYSGYAIIGKKRYLSAINIGRNPTLTSAKKTTFEVHIINFKKNILDKEIEVVFLDKVRREKRFSSITKLKSAIQKDINLITAKYSVPAPNSLQPLVS